MTSRRIYALTGIPPEIQAYAMAKYSRSAQGMLESVRELSVQRAEEFLTTFYFEYGHRSIADMAHVVMALENVSLVAAIAVEDEPVWDGQERSTRYQDFRRSGYYVPPELPDDAAADYRAAADRLFAAYWEQARGLRPVLAQAVPRPPDMDEDKYNRTLRARAFDVARSLLPLATHTSVGQVVSARTLESQINRLLGDPRAEMQAIGEELRQASRRQPEAPLLESLMDSDPTVRERLAPPSAPTLVKYTAPNLYAQRVIAAVRAQCAAVFDRMGSADLSKAVELSAPPTLATETVATLLYRASPRGHSYRQCLEAAACLTPDEVDALLDLVPTQRGTHDEILREMRAGYPFAFDFLIDVGAYRDMHRHRRCVQLLQDFSPVYGFADPEETFVRGLTADGAQAARTMGMLAKFTDAMQEAFDAAARFGERYPQQAAYLLPLGARCRSLFKMDAAEAAYMTELRTGVAGHFSYRFAAWGMVEEVQRREPWLARTIRATDPNAVVDFLAR